MALFDQRLAGPPPGGATYGSSLWIDLGVIPVGSKLWIGSRTYSSPYKTGTFTLRTNKAGKSAGNTTDTVALDSWSSSPKNKSNTKDISALGIYSVVGTGVERWWLQLASKSSGAQTYTYIFNFAQV
jgi:hypothetical protein